MLLKHVLKHKTSFICYFEFHGLYLFTFSRLKSLPCPSSTHFAGQLANIIGPLKCYNDDYQCYDYQCYPRFTLISAFYPLIRVLLSYPRFTLSSAFYSISVFYPLVRPDIRPSIRPDIRPDIHPSVCPSIRPPVRIRVLPLPWTRQASRGGGGIAHVLIGKLEQTSVVGSLVLGLKFLYFYFYRNCKCCCCPIFQPPFCKRRSKGLGLG